MPENKHLHFLLIVLYAALAVFGVYLFVRFLLPCLLPFILAYLTAAAIEAPVRHLNETYHIKRSFCSAICTVIVFLMLSGIVTVIAARAAYEITDLIKNLPQKMEELEVFISGKQNSIYLFIMSMSGGYRDFLLGAYQGLIEKTAELPKAATDMTVSFLSSFAASAPAVFLFVITYILGVFTISSSFPDIRKFMIRQIPPKWRPGARGLKSDIISTMAKWLKAQVILMLVTFFELTVGFLIIRVDYAALLAFSISLVDALPIFGVGTVLFPWALAAVIEGRYEFAVSLLILYCVISLVRRLLEPHVVSSQLGVHPAAVLISIYAGFRFAGVWGMISFPLALLLLCRLNDLGQLTLWK